MIPCGMKILGRELNSTYSLILGTEILSPKNIAFKNNLFVPYQEPLKFGFSANNIALPEPTLLTIIEADFFR